jgi:hypothetical protein
MELDAAKIRSAGLYADILLCRRRFWDFAGNVKTQDENVGRVLPFPKYGFLEASHAFLTSTKVGMILKSRQMLMSYLAMLDKLWCAWRCDSSEGQTYFGAGISKREEDAIHLLERVKFMYSTLPQLLRDYNPIKKDTQTYLEFEKGGKLKVLPASEDIGRTYTFTDILFDEFAFAPWDRKMWGSLRPTIGTEGRMHGISTPNGKFNLFHDIWTDTDHYKGVGRHRLHWSEHPNRDDGWATEMQQSMPTETWSREYELSFATMAGKRVYPEFKETLHVADFDYMPGRDLVVYETWDFGYHHPAVLWAIKNRRDQLQVVDELMGEDIDTASFADRVLERREAMFPGCLFREFCDVAGMQKSAAPKAVDARSDIEILNQKGIRPKAKKIGINQGCNVVRRMMWPLRRDGHPWLMVHPRCQTLIDGFQGGYCYEDKDVPKEEPAKDGYYDHLQDCIRYKAVWLFPELSDIGLKVRKQRRRSRYEDYVTVKDEFGGY